MKAAFTSDGVIKEFKAQNVDFSKINISKSGNVVDYVTYQCVDGWEINYYHNDNEWGVSDFSESKGHTKEKIFKSLKPAVKDFIKRSNIKRGV